MKCPTCGTTAASGAKFCAECGTKLANACPVCGTGNAPGAKFCVECGAGFIGAAAAGAAQTPAAGGPDQSAGPVGPSLGASPTPTAQRRLVSVLFGDLVGSTTLAEDRDPEETRELLTRYFDVASELIGRYGGTVEKFIGDAVMAVWGVPKAFEDDPERAVRAALDLVSAVGSITDAGQPLQMRAAVLTGEAAATVGATGHGIVAGDLVNTASRLQGMASAGAVLVGESTYHATREAIAYEEVGEQLLKGKTSPVPAWRAVQVLGMRGGARRRSALEPPFVGRDDELRLIKDLFHATVRESKPRLVTIIGQAGIGKSRLGWEFEKYIDGVTQTVYWHAGRSPSYGEGISYWALAEMVRERAGIAETDDPETARTRLTACVDQWLTDPDERAWIEPCLAGLLGLEDLPATQREELFAAWRTFFERIADHDPVILVFKDLHWADTGLLEFIEHVLAWSKNHPIYVLAMTRPDLLERNPSWSAGVRNATTLVLEPLPDAPMEDLLRGLVPGLPDSAIDAVLARAEGMPLYAVETVRMLLDRGQLQSSGDGFALSGPIEHLAVPETLHALVAARIDANTPEDRALLADASILGQSFTMGALSGITGQDESDLVPALDRLVRRELLIRDDDPRSPERGQHRFVQAVVREVAYETLAKADRRAKHLAAARYFETLGEDEISGVLASHYLEALRATSPGPEADALAAQARIALRAASERAESLHSYAVAYRHAEDALGITTDPTERGLLHEAAARTGSWLSLPEAVEHALAAAEIGAATGDRATQNRARALAATIQTNYGSSDAIKTLEPAVATLAENEPEAARVFAELARVYMLTDRFEEAVTMSDRALRAASRERDLEAIAEALTTRASAIWPSGRVDEAEAGFRGAMLLAERGSHVSSALRARNNLMSVAAFERPGRELLDILGEGIDMARRYGLSSWLSPFLTTRAVLLIDIGDWAGATHDVAEAAEIPLSPDQAGMLAMLRAELAAFIGDAEQFRAAADESARHMASVGTLPQLAGVAMEKARALLALGDPRAALDSLAGHTSGSGLDLPLVMDRSLAAANLGDATAHAAVAEAVTSPESLPWTRGLRRKLAATDAALAGGWDEAHAAYAEAMAGFRELDANIYVAFIGLEFDAFLGAVYDDARRAGEEAVEFFASRGAYGVVERYRAAFQAIPAPAPVEGRSTSGAPAHASEVEAR
jgi:class 3 adenylate cyclase/tetratricopeptide (TPR) repeat protein